MAKDGGWVGRRALAAQPLREHARRQPPAQNRALTPAVHRLVIAGLTARAYSTASGAGTIGARRAIRSKPSGRLNA